MKKNLWIKRWDIVFIKDKYIYDISLVNNENSLQDYLKHEIINLKKNDIRPCVVIKVSGSNISYIPMTTIIPTTDYQKQNNKILTTILNKGTVSYLKTSTINTINYHNIIKKSKIYLNKEDRKIVYNLIDNFFKD